MVEFLRNLLFGGKDGRSASTSATGASKLQLAAAALLVEAAKLDGDFDQAERRRIAELLGTRLGVEHTDIDALIDAADRKSDEAGGLYAFTREIRDNFAHAERVEMIEMLWEVAYADGSLHDFEANLLRRVAGLLYVTDRESGEARKRVLDRLEIRDKSPGD